MDFTAYTPERRGYVIQNYLENLARSRSGGNTAEELSFAQESPAHFAGQVISPEQQLALSSDASGGAAAFVADENLHQYAVAPPVPTSSSIHSSNSQSGSSFASDFMSFDQHQQHFLMQQQHQMQPGSLNVSGFDAASMQASTSSSPPSPILMMPAPQAGALSESGSVQTTAGPSSGSAPKKTLVDLLEENLAQVERRKGATATPKPAKAPKTPKASGDSKKSPSLRLSTTSPAKKLNSNSGSNAPPSCSVCNVTFRTAREAQKHPANKLHQANMKLFLEQYNQAGIVPSGSSSGDGTISADNFQQPYWLGPSDSGKATDTMMDPSDVPVAASASPISSHARSPSLKMDDVIERQNQQTAMHRSTRRNAGS